MLTRWPSATTAPSPLLRTLRSVLDTENGTGTFTSGFLPSSPLTLTAARSVVSFCGFDSASLPDEAHPAESRAPPMIRAAARKGNRRVTVDLLVGGNVGDTLTSVPVAAVRVTPRTGRHGPVTGP